MVTFNNIWLFVVACLALIVASNKLRQEIINITFLIFKNRPLSIKIYSLLFLPGVIIHELSHFFTAAVLFIPTGKISIFPQNFDEERVRLGSVQVAKSDFFRSSLVGIAPLFTGSILIWYLVSAHLTNYVPHTITDIPQIATQMKIAAKIPQFWLALYFMVAVTNTMFTSKEDARYWPIAALFFGPIIILAFLLNFSEPILEIAKKIIETIAVQLTSPLLLATTIDLCLILPLNLIKRSLQTMRQVSR